VDRHPISAMSPLHLQGHVQVAAHSLSYSIPISVMPADPLDMKLSLHTYLDIPNSICTYLPLHTYLYIHISTYLMPCNTCRFSGHGTISTYLFRHTYFYSPSTYISLHTYLDKPISTYLSLHIYFYLYIPISTYISLHT